MNLRTLLLSSAAALAAASGAHAADAIVAAEPEPLEYVKVCDAYGKGYFYLPGTETCLKIGGMVRTEAQFYSPYGPKSGDGTLWHTRFELNVDTATDTEYGALKTNVVLRSDYEEGQNSMKLLWGNISLGGFTVGKLDSQYNLYMGYAGDIINDDVVYDGPYELNQLTYNYDAGNGFTAVVSLEDSYSSGTDSSSYGSGWWTTSDEANHYIPDVVAGLGYKAGAFGFKVVGGYDSVVEEGAVKARVDADFGSFSAFLMGGYNTDGKKLNKYAGTNLNENSCPAGRPDLCGWGDWAVWGGVSVPFTDKVKWDVQLVYTDSKIFNATTNLKFNPVKDLLIEPEVAYTNWDSVNQDQWSGILRFQRSF